MEILNQTAN